MTQKGLQKSLKDFQKIETEKMMADADDEMMAEEMIEAQEI